MSRYLGAFVLLALSATSVLAAPADIPGLPTVPNLVRSNNKVYSPSTLHKRDWEYPASTKDCRLSEVPKDSSTLAYTHDGVEYSEECLTRLALSVPFEDRKSCRSSGPKAIGYDEECLFKKAFEEDWKYDLEKAKQEELAWRAANPSKPSSDAWRTNHPTAVSDCIVLIELEGVLEIVDGEKEKEKGKRDGEGKEVKGKKDATKTSDALDGWSPYSVAPSGETLDNECLVRLVLGLKVVIDLGSCSADPSSAPKPHSVSEVAAPSEKHGLLGGRSSTEVATRRDIVGLVVSVLAALELGCLIEIIVKIIAAVGIDTKLLLGPLDIVVDLAVGLLAALLNL